MFKFIHNYLRRFWSWLVKKQEAEPQEAMARNLAQAIVQPVKRNKRGRIPKVLRRIRTMQGKSTGDY